MADDVNETRKRMEEALRYVSSPEYRQRELQKKWQAQDLWDRERAQRQAELDEKWRQGAPERMARLREEIARRRQEEAMRQEAVALLALQERQRITELVETSWKARTDQFQGVHPYTGPCAWGHYTPMQMVQRAKANRPSALGDAVTDFSGWVFKLEHDKDSPYESLTIGKLLEREIVERDRSRRELAFVRGTTPAVLGWRVLYEDDLTPDAHTFRVSTLRVCGTPLTAKPDLVLDDTRTGCIYIVDRKASNIEPPTFSWHNVRAQLWAYSWIDDWQDRPMRLCVEVWRHDEQGKPQSCQVISWAKGDTGPEQAIQRLFEIYGGVLLAKRR